MTPPPRDIRCASQETCVKCSDPDSDICIYAGGSAWRAELPRFTRQARYAAYPQIAQFSTTQTLAPERPRVAIFRATISISQESLGGQGSNTFHYQHPSTDIDDAADALDAAAASLEAMYTALTGALAGGSKFDFDGAWIQVNGPDAGIVHTSDSWNVTTVAGEFPMPPANCIVAGWRTARRGRGTIGRTFFGPVRLNDSDPDGTPKSTALTIFRNATEGLLDGHDPAEDGQFGLWKRTANTFLDYTDVVVHDRYAVLRSRRD